MSIAEEAVIGSPRACSECAKPQRHAASEESIATAFSAEARVVAFDAVSSIVWKEMGMKSADMPAAHPAPRECVPRMRRP
eukprot:1533587-Prymnesium_polylepis.1